MNHLTQIFSTANRLQASRTFLRDLRGLDKTPEGIEFAKAIGNAVAFGASPQDVVEEVVKAMGGNEGLAMEVLESVQELAKAHVEHHTRTLANGKTVDVKAYETARTAAMKQTTTAHGATFHAIRTKTPEAHENAAAAHAEAGKQHGEAHELHPIDSPEVGVEHAKLKGQHQVAVDYHKGEAQNLRNGEEYEKAKNDAQVASNLASHVGMSAMAVGRHAAASKAHEKADKMNPGQGHKEKAESHAALASANHAFNDAGDSPIKTKARWDAMDDSGQALKASHAAHQDGEKDPGLHKKAAEAHGKAAEAHMELHGAHESDEEGHHGKIAKRHIDLHTYHSQKADALAGEDVAKAEVAAHTRTVDGKVQQVHAYQTVQRASSIPAKAHEHMLGLNPPWQMKAAKARDASQAASDASHGKDHMKAADAHKAAALEHEKVNTPDSRALAAEHRSIAAEHENHAGHPYNTKAKELAGKADAAGVSALSRASAEKSGHASMYTGKAHKHEAMENGSPHIAHESARMAHSIAKMAHERVASAATDPKRKKAHLALAAEHAELAAYHDGRKGENVAKAEGTMTAMDGGTDLAAKTGGAALAVEGRPDEKDRKDEDEEIGKAQVAAHTRTQGGKVVQVSAYETHQTAAHAFSSAAHKATSEIGSKKGPEGHTAAAAAHTRAAEALRETAKYAPEEWMKKGHEDQATLHEHYAKNHAAAAKAAGQKADTGVNSAQHTEEDIKHLENHEDYQGFGYLGHSKRDSATDLALTQAANKAGIDRHELAAHLLSQSGRHMMDADEGHESEAQPKEAFEAKHARRVAHYQRWLTDPKNQKNYGIKEYASDLKKRAPATPKGWKDPSGTVAGAGGMNTRDTDIKNPG
jgi:hypothetical protein